MDPDSPELIKQVAFERGVSPETDLSSLTSQMQESIKSEVEVTRKYINSALEMLKSLRSFKDGHLKIRLYSRFCPYWMYLFDEKTIYVGILEKGIRGQDSPALMLAKHPELASPFDLFKNSWDSLWAEATKVE